MRLARLLLYATAFLSILVLYHVLVRSAAAQHNHPPQDVQLRDNPDGRNHLCAPPPWANYPPNAVFCFSLGGAI
jgi:hypothetical protein